MRIKIISLIILINLSALCANGLKKYTRDYSQTQSLTAEIATHEGKILVELNFLEAPQTVANFENLAKSGYYQGVIFHRVIQGFMIQAGDPTGTGRGGPGYNILDEKNKLTHETAVISMANIGKPNSGGSQFFITQQPHPQLNGKHTVFGKIISGEQFTYLIEQGDPILFINIIETSLKNPKGEDNGSN
jgi:peptidyl-prolyl cis-trans isomerase B (cyclophilin B)